MKKYLSILLICLLTGFSGAYLNSIITLHERKSPIIVGLDVDKLIYMKYYAEVMRTKDEIDAKKVAEDYKQQLPQKLRQLAEDNGWIIIEAKLLVGANDITEKLADEFMQSSNE